jgi:hypothetical protein
MALYTDNAQPEAESSSSALQKIIYGYKKKQALFVATKLELANILSNGPTNADEIAKATSVNSRSSYHLMRLLISRGIFFAKNNDEFHLNPMGKSLLTGTSDSLRATILAKRNKGYQAGGNLLYSLKTGEDSFYHTFKMSFYRYFKQNAEAVVNFNEWMKEKTKKSIIPLFEAYEFFEVKTIVDVRGNIGTLTAVILKPNPKMQAILFDREDVVVGANQVLEVARLVDRCQIAGRNFFDSLLRGGALYLLSRVLLNTE